MSKEFFKGTFILTGAKIYFVIAAYCIYIGLARIIGPQQFGIYGVVVGLISIFNMALITGTLQAVSRFVSGAPEEEQRAVKREALKIQLVFASSLFIIFNIFASQIASLLNDSALTGYLRVASIIFLCYAFYAVFIGYLNGTKRFRAQALFDISYSTIKLVLILGLAVLGFQALGALSGFALASFIIVVASFFIVGMQKSESAFSWKKILNFELTIIGLAFLINLMMNLDLLMLKALSPQAEGNTLAGLYTAALTISRVPYQLLMGINLAIFPLIASLAREGKREDVQSHINQGLRLYLGFLLLAAVGISSSADATMGLIYPASYREGSAALFITSYGYLFFSLWVFIATIFSAIGKPKRALLFGVGTVLVQAGLLAWLIPTYGLVGASLGSAIAWGCGALVGAAMLSRDFGGVLSFTSLFKLVAAAAICFTISFNWHVEKINLLGKDVIIALVYGIILILLREIQIKDIKGLLSRKNAKSEIK